MRQRVWVGLFASVGLIVLSMPLPVQAVAIRPPAPGPVRVGQADALVVGRVVALEDKDVPAAPFAGATNKVNYRIAVVKVTEAIKGVKGKDTIRVGFQAPPTPVAPGGGVRPFIRFRGVILQVGQDGLFYLNRHEKEDFYVLPAFYSFSSSQAPNFAQEVAVTKKVVRILEDPTPALKSKDAKDRLLAASALINRYRNRRPGTGRTAPIDAEQSRLILHVLADANWTQPFRFGEDHPMQLFNLLGLTAQDGWTPPRTVKTPQDFPNAARDWVRAHADTYRIQRFVANN
jgi:hypothetical protein